MATIIVSNENSVIHELELPGGAISIGRAVDNDVNLTDTTVSSHHAKIYTFFGSSYIEDLGSTNGTFINGKRIKKHTLHPGDIVCLGKHQISLHAE